MLSQYRTLQMDCRSESTLRVGSTSSYLHQQYPEPSGGTSFPAYLKTGTDEILEHSSGAVVLQRVSSS